MGLYGFGAVAGGCFAWGSFGVPTKLPQVEACRVHPLIYQCYFSVAVFASSCVAFFFVQPEFTFWGVLAGAIWTGASVLSLYSMRLLGIAVAQGIWAGVTILVSFAWGFFWFADPVKSVAGCILALVFLVVGVLMLALSRFDYYLPVERPTSLLSRFSNGPTVSTGNDSYSTCSRRSPSSPGRSHSSPVSSQEDRKSHGDMPIDLESESGWDEDPDWQAWDDTDWDFGKHDEHEELAVGPGKHREKLYGYAACIALGLLNGSVMVPLRFSSVQGVGYVPSFGFGVMLATIIFVVIFFLRRRSGQGFPQLHISTALAGIASGVMWSTGNVCAVVATLDLGLIVGSPLTQCSLLVAGLWGMLLVDELNGLQCILQFFFGAAVLLTGACLISIYGVAEAL